MRKPSGEDGSAQPEGVEFDVFLSHAWADGERPGQIKDALQAAGLRVWFDATEISDFASITSAVTEGLAKSKTLVAYYSETYPLRRACQWELTVAYLAAQSEGDPRRRVLVVNPERTTTHIHPIELRDAKFLSAPTDDSTLQHLVRTVKEHVGLLNGTLTDIRPLTAPLWYGMKPAGSTRFVGRLREMWRIHSLLHAGEVAQITGASSATGGIGQVHGLAGVGKSLLAEEYALRFGAGYQGGVFWLRAFGNDDAKAALGPKEREAARVDQTRDIAEELGIDIQGLSPKQIEGAIRVSLTRRNRPCLWIVDDIPSGLGAEELRRWFSPLPLAKTLVTTRSREYSALAHAIDLAVLQRDEAFELLTRQCQPSSEDEKTQAYLLSEELGYHALAVDVTASALVSYGESEPYRKFREELAKDDTDALELAKDLVGVLPNGHEASIAKTMLRSIRLLGPRGKDFLRLASILAVAPIPALLLREVLKLVDRISGSAAEQFQREGFSEVTKASLADTAGDSGDARSVHTLVSRTMRFQFPGDERTQEMSSAATCALAARLEVADDVREHPRVAMYMPHARLLLRNSGTIDGALLGLRIGRYDHRRGDYRSALEVEERVVSLRKLRLGEEHPDTLTAINNVATTLTGLGRWPEARTLLEKVLQLRISQLGETHKDTVATRTNLGAVLSLQGDLGAAESFQRETLVICQRSFGKENKHTLNATEHLAGTLKERGNLDESQKLQGTVLEARSRVLGEGHVETLRAKGNLAWIMSARGDFPGARTIQESVVVSSVDLLGEEHPQTLSAQNNLAQTLKSQDDLAGARELQEKVLTIRRRTMGDEHPDTLTATNNLAATLLELGDPTLARELQEPLVATCRSLLGESHPQTLAAMSCLATTLLALGYLREARRLLEPALAALRVLYGEQHPTTLTVMSNLALTLKGQCDVSGSQRLYERVISAGRSLLGEEHPQTLKAMGDFALSLQFQGILGPARQMQENILDTLGRVSGWEHHETLKAMHNLAYTLSLQGHLSDAREMQERALAGVKKVRGTSHPQSIDAMNLMAAIRESQGDVVGARALYETVEAELLNLPGDHRRVRYEVRQNLIRLLPQNGPNHPTTD